MDVSVIIPVYNTERYLSACVDSVLMQTHVSFEIILVDDGSTDLSGTICDRYAEENKNIKVLHIQNSGPATAKNHGLDLAQGNYVAFTDSDDRMEPLMLHKMITAGYENDADIICCNYKQINEAGRVSHLNSSYKQYVLNHEEGLVHFFSKNKIYSQCWTKLYNRQMLTDNHIENDPGLRTDEDFIFNIRAFVHAKATIIVDEPLYIYTHRENSLARDYFKSNISQYIDNRIQRVKVTQEAVKNESDAIKHWSIVHIIMYYNELLGKVALFPEYYSDKRIKVILKFIKKNKAILNQHYALCGFSKIGKILITYLPSWLYLTYRKSRV